MPLITLAGLDAEDRSGADLADLLGVPAPPVWPPQHNDAATRDWLRQMQLDNPGQDRWMGHYVIAVDGEVEALVGIAGYTGPPQDGVVDIGYAIIEPAQRKGYASEAVRLLVDSAFEGGAHTVRANTLADGVASQGVLARCGFSKSGESVDPEEGPIWTFALDRP